MYKKIEYVVMALVTFIGSQLILFSGPSYKIAVGTQGRINGSMFAIILDLVSVSLIYKFWRAITDGKDGERNYIGKTKKKKSGCCSGEWPYFRCDH